MFKKSAIFKGYSSISIYANYSNMVRFGSVEDNGFKRLLGELTRWELQIRDSVASQLIQLIEEIQIDKLASLFFNSYGPGFQFNALGST